MMAAENSSISALDFEKLSLSRVKSSNRNREFEDEITDGWMNTDKIHRG